MPTPPDWIKVAVAITPGFETVGDPYEGVSGDFDAMGISCGALQWNIGSDSLQPMVRAVGKAQVQAAMTTCGAEMWTACNSNVTKGLAIVRAWQTGSTLKAKPRAELRALMGSPAMRAQQDLKIRLVADLAYNRAKAWSAAGGVLDKRLFCWFFDLVTQNGGLKGITRQTVLDFITTNTPGKVDDVICDFLEGQTKPGGHNKDARANGKAWRDAAKDEKLELLVLSYLRAAVSNPLWRVPVMNRKATIAIGKGRVNGADWDFSKYGL